MGAAASALPDKVDRPTIEKLAGGSFDAGKFDELNKLSLADEDGVVARDDFIAFAEASAAGAGDDATAAASSASNVGTAAATAAEKDGDDAAAVDTVGELKTTPQPSAPSERRRSSLERGASTKNQLTFGLAVPVDGSVATTTTVGVRVVRSEKLKQFVRVISGSPALLSKHALVAIELDQISDADAAAQRATRQKALRAQAAAALARFETLPAEEKARAKNDGDLELYSDQNLDKREAIREDPAIVTILEEWWSAAKTFDDKDGNDSLDINEYAGFHKRLLRLLEFNASDDKLTDDEAEKVMLEDFRVDAGEDGQVVKSEFLFSVFQLADQWVETVALEDYVAFLTRGMHVVYDDLFAADRIRVPASWQSALKGGRSIHALSVSKCIEMIAEIYRLKITQNHTKDERGKERSELGDFVIVYLRRTHGSPKSLSKILKAFVTGILDAINHRSALVGSGGVHAWLVLFAQLCGFASPSGKKLAAMPPEASRFVTAMLERVEPLVALTRQRLPASAESDLHKKLVGGKNEKMIGFIEATAARRLLTSVVKDELHVTETDFVRAANSTLRSIERTLNVTTGARLESAAEIAATPEAEPLLQVVTSADFLSVLASVWCAIFQVDASAAAAASEAAVTNAAIKIAANLDHLSGRHLI